MLAVKPPIPFLSRPCDGNGSPTVELGVPHMYTPRLDGWNMPELDLREHIGNTRTGRRGEDLLDWDQIRDPGHMRLTVSASGVEDGGTTYFSNLDPNVPLGGQST